MWTADVAVNGDAKKVLGDLLPLVKENRHKDWIGEFKTCYDIEYEKIIKSSLFQKRPRADKGEDDGYQIRMSEVIHLVSQFTRGEAIVVTDVGQHQMATARYYMFSKPRSSITSGGLGTMGFGLPAAMGAKLGAPDRLVIAIVGDGGLQMTIQELATVFQSDIKIKILLLNNNFLGMVRQWQQLFFEKRYSFTELQNPDFQMVARGYGIATDKVVEHDELEEKLRSWLTSDQAHLLEVMVEKEENVFPMVPSGEGVEGMRFS